MIKKFLSYVIPVAICFLLGFIASGLQTDAVDNWYPYLIKPDLNPPNSVFPIAWSILYLFSGISAGLILNTPTNQKKSIIGLWAVQQFFNFTWSIMFFYLQNPFLGLINILILDLLVFYYIVRTWQINRLASILFWPYLAWLLFATYLNVFIYFNN